MGREKKKRIRNKKSLKAARGAKARRADLEALYFGTATRRKLLESQKKETPSKQKQPPKQLPADSPIDPPVNDVQGFTEFLGTLANSDRETSSTDDMEDAVSDSQSTDGSVNLAEREEGEVIREEGKAESEEESQEECEEESGNTTMGKDVEPQLRMAADKEFPITAPRSLQTAPYNWNSFNEPIPFPPSLQATSILLAGSVICSSNALASHLAAQPDFDLLSSTVPPIDMPERLWQGWQLRALPKVLQEETEWRQLSKQPTVCSWIASHEALTFWKSISAYSDVQYGEETYRVTACVRALTVLHITRHAVRCNLLARQNFGKFKEILDSGGEADIRKCTDIHDSSFVRPRILILTPTRQSARSFALLISDIVARPGRVQKSRKLREMYGDECLGHAPQTQCPSVKRLIEKKKPLDFSELFRGDFDDMFAFGVGLPGEGRVALFPRDFLDADIIIASPLGLIREMEKSKPGMVDEGELTTQVERNVGNSDFLSSIDICVVDKADALFMQNWTHVFTIFEKLNQLPKVFTKGKVGCNILRLRPAYVAKNARNLRQTIMLSGAGIFCDAVALWASGLCCNFRGITKFGKSSPVLSQGQQLVARQIFHRLSSQESDEKACDYIRRHFPPKFFSVGESDSILLVCPSIVEFFQIRKAIKESTLIPKDNRELKLYAVAHEGMGDQECHNNRRAFVTGQKKLMVVTERWLWFRRFKIRGANHVMFSAPPLHPEVFLEILENLVEPRAAISLTLFTPTMHLPQLQRIVGVDEACRMNEQPNVDKMFVYE